METEATEIEPVVEEIEAPEAEVELDDEGNPIEADEDLDEWTDDKGRVHKVPKDLKAGYIRTQDYTQKTMTLAESRKATEALQAEVAQRQAFVEANATEVAKFGALDHQAKEWAQWISDNPDDATPADYHKLQTLKEAAGAQYHTLTQLQQQAASEAQRADATAQQAMRTALTDPKTGIQGYSPELESKIAAFAVADLGYQPEEVAAVRDPRAVKVLHLAMLGKQATAKQSAAKTVQAQQATAPVRGVGASRASNTGQPSDNAPIEAWVAWRNKQAANKARR